jgi:hypothetical protein
VSTALLQRIEVANFVPKWRLGVKKTKVFSLLTAGFFQLSEKD